MHLQAPQALLLAAMDNSKRFNLLGVWFLLAIQPDKFNPY
jgi:hypothetical protein